MRSIFCTAMASATLGLASPAGAADVTITLDGVRNGAGDLYVSLQTRAQFLKDEGSHGAVVSRPAPGQHRITLRDVPAGEYSVSVWHDTDGDKKFSTDARGIPTDGWAMINGAALRAAPQWDQVRFTVPAAGVATTLDMIYPAE